MVLPKKLRDKIYTQADRQRDTDILKVDFFARSKLNFSNFAQEKVEKYH